MLPYQLKVGNLITFNFVGETGEFYGQVLSIRPKGKKYYIAINPIGVLSSGSGDLVIEHRTSDLYLHVRPTEEIETVNEWKAKNL